MNLTQDNIIGDLVAEDYRAASVFGNYGIDFCCQGNRTINDACVKKGIDSSKVVRDLNEILSAKSSGSIDYRSWPLDLLADYVEKKHHRYVENKIPILKQYLDKICKVHGKHHPELFKINELFIDSAGELTKHMKKEELVLFPFIRKMVAAKTNGTKAPEQSFGSVENPVEMMMHEHTVEGERFRQIEELSAGYNPPAEACNTYRVSFAMLKEFEEDLHLHIHIENNILFPKSIELEKELRA